jgi:NADPH-dependent curcumin reductase CurA
MTEKIARQVVLAARPHGRPKPSDFRLEETAIPTPASAFIGMLEGRNFGKLIIRVDA